MTLFLDADSLNILHTILSEFPYTFYAYGSRVKGKHKKFSDIDLCIMEDIDLSSLGNLQEAFEESNLPMKVDVVVWPQLSDNFKKLIKDDLYLFKNEQ